jgi:predicted DNA-binding transcriptional regulator AlpA
MMNVIRNLLE